MKDSWTVCSGLVERMLSAAKGTSSLAQGSQKQSFWNPRTYGPCGFADATPLCLGRVLMIRA